MKVYSTFSFDINEIRSEIIKLKDISEKLIYIKFIIKEVDFKISNFNNSKVAKLKLPSKGFELKTLKKLNIILIEDFPPEEIDDEIKLLIKNYIERISRIDVTDTKMGLMEIEASVRSFENTIKKRLSYYNKIKADIHSEYEYYKSQLDSLKHEADTTNQLLKNESKHYQLLHRNEKLEKPLEEKTLVEINPKQEEELELIQSKPAKRLNLSPNKKEMLNSKIVEEVKDFIDAGKGTQEQAFKELSEKSKRLFGYELTSKQIEGRFSRNKKKKF